MPVSDCDSAVPTSVSPSLTATQQYNKTLHVNKVKGKCIYLALFIARQQRSMLTRDIDIANLSVRPSVRPQCSGIR